MRCCVPTCKNDSKHISKSQGITFHVFPNDKGLRTAWLRALGKQSWTQKERSAVCSEHFLCEDLYETKNGLRKVHSGAVPIILQVSSNIDYSESVSMKICRVCLVMDSKLISMKKFKLDQAFELLTGISLCEEERLPYQLCPECAQRLLNFSKFLRKSLRANSLMTEILRKQDQLTVQSILSIDRESNQLATNLSLKYYHSDHFDVQIQEEVIEPTEVLPDNDLETELKDEINNEDSVIFVNEFDDIKLDNGEYCDTYNYKDNGNTEYNDESNANFAAYDNDYSTDDSLPLEQRRIKKKSISKKVPKKLKIVSDVPKIDRRRKPFYNDDLNETLFTITDLNVQEQIAQIDKRQESANYRNAVFKCTECYKGFLDEDAYNSHMLRHTVACGEYRCNICKIHFKHPHALRKHITVHHTQRFSCNDCNFVTNSRQSARLHERWHKGTRYKCPHCPEDFVKLTTYMGHIRIKHPSDFVCQLCGYSFVSEKGIMLHKKLKHRLESAPIPEDGPLCELCNLRFANTDALKRHTRISARHTAGKGLEPNTPSIGRKAREENRRLREDNKKLAAVAFRDGPIPCEQCGLQLEDSRAYHSHFRRVHPDKNRTKYPAMKSPCMCEVCGKIFQSHTRLKDHTWIHTGERPFKCDLCGKSFRMKQRLDAHRKVHSAQKATYGCNLCEKQFSTQGNRQRHMFAHTGLKPFKCEMCGKCFKHADEKRSHIAYVHLKKPWPKRSRGKRRDSR